MTTSPPTACAAVLLVLLTAVACVPTPTPPPQDPTTRLAERTATLADARRAIVDDRLSDAIAQLDALLERDPSDATALGLRGIAFAREGRVYPAVADLAAAANIAPSVDAYLNLGLAQVQFGFCDRAEVALRAALELAPDEPEVQHALATSLSGSGRHGEALGLVEKVLRVRPRDPQVHVLHGTVLFGLARYDDAEAAMLRAIQLESGYTPALFNLAKVYEASGRGLDAAHLYRCYLERRPDAPDAGKVRHRAATAPPSRACPGSRDES